MKGLLLLVCLVGCGLEEFKPNTDDTGAPETADSDVVDEDEESSDVGDGTDGDGDTYGEAAKECVASSSSPIN